VVVQREGGPIVKSRLALLAAAGFVLAAGCNKADTPTTSTSTDAAPAAAASTNPIKAGGAQAGKGTVMLGPGYKDADSRVGSKGSN